MKHKDALKVLSFTSLFTFSLFASAGDEAVNCRNEVQQIPVYGGLATCYDGNYRITRLIPDGFSSTVFLTERNNNVLYSCLAFVPFSHLVEEVVQVCDYTPLADFTLRPRYDGTAATGFLDVTANASDRDGTIVKHEWWVNGTFYGNSTPQLPTVHSFTDYTITYKVTDNDGYTDTQTKTAYVDPDQDPCWGLPGQEPSC